MWYIARLRHYLHQDKAIPTLGKYSRHDLKAAAIKVTSELHEREGTYLKSKTFKYYR